MICVPVNIGHIILYWVSSKKLIFPLISEGVQFMIPWAILEPRFPNSIWSLANPEWSKSSTFAMSISGNQSLINRGWVAPGVTSQQKETFHELNFDACGQGSNSNFSAPFLFEILSSVLDGALDVYGICSHGLPSAGCDVCHGEWTFSNGLKGCEQSTHS